ncbi:MAG: cell cycle histidine kinase CckA [Rhodoplanes sp.]|jgi:two-component system cell cycle sensor histidine kinase/response regulator CckA
MTTQELDKGPGLDALPGERRGSIQLVLLVAIGLIGAASALMFLGRSQAEPYVLALLAVLGMVGVFSLFAAAAGILRVAGGSEGNPAFKRVLDDAVEGIAVTDESGRVVYANAAYCRLVDADDLNDVRPVERAFIGDPDVSEAVYRLLKAAREGRRLQEEVRVSAVPGRPARWLQLRVRPLGMGDAEAHHAVWTVADVTPERERQESVFQELQDAIDFLDHAPAGFFSVDGSGQIGYVNATLAGWLDYDLTEVSSGGLTLADILPGDGAALLAPVGRPGEVKTEVLDIDLRTRGGKTLPARLYHRVAFAADGAPGPSRTLVLNRARSDGNDPQRAAEVRFMRFFHNTPMAIATVDRAGRIARNNALLARMFQGVLKGEETPPEGRSILAIVAERDRPAVEAAIAKAAGGQGDVLPVDAALAGESERWARFYVTAVEDEIDQERAIVYALETTEQRALQKQVDQAQKMDSVGKLAGGIAHDFNNVLSAIMMATDFLLNAHKPTDPSFQDIMQIKQNANRAAALVRQLLAFSRRQTLRPQVLDLDEALSDISMLLKRLIGEKVSLEVKPGRGLWPVKADLSQFEQVIVNLAVNARDAMPDGGRLTLRTTNVGEAESRSLAYKGVPPGEYVLIEVADTGTGIPEEIRDRIFEPFFSTKEVGMGTGLGLSTVYGIINQTGGFVFVDSEIGRGTTFRIFLPRHVATAEEIASAAGQSAPADSAKAAPADHTGHGTVLLVEDEEGLRGLNARGLASRGYTVCEASNGVEAIALIEAGQRVDLVVSDVVMPEMDGPTLLKELRRRDPTLKIIFVSGYAEEAFAKNLPEGGQFAFLAKPFTLKQLVAAVKETMGP